MHALCRPAAARAGSWKLRAAAEAANTSRAGMNSMSTHGPRRWNWAATCRREAAERVPVVGLCLTCDNNVTVGHWAMRAIDYKRN